MACRVKIFWNLKIMYPGNWLGSICSYRRSGKSSTEPSVSLVVSTCDIGVTVQLMSLWCSKLLAIADCVYFMFPQVVQRR